MDNRVLAIDYGTKRIGFALSDPLRLFPSIISTIPNDNISFTKLLEIISHNNVTSIIIGCPIQEKEKKSKLVEEILKFKSKLDNLTKLKSELWDEHYTSKIAEARIINSVTKKSKRRNKSLVDAHSAAVILEEYLKTNRIN